MQIDGHVLINNLKLQRNSALDALAEADAQRHALQLEVDDLRARLDAAENPGPAPVEVKAKK